MPKADLDVVATQLLEAASNDLALKQQNLTERQQSGRNIKTLAQEVQSALLRVEGLQDGVTFQQPRSEPEAEIATKLAIILTYLLDGEESAVRHLGDILAVLEEIYEWLPEEEGQQFFLARQGAPYMETGQAEHTATTKFDNGRVVRAETHSEAISKLVQVGDECGDPHGKTPPIVDGEVLTVIRMRNRRLDRNGIWVEQVQRPVYKGVAPRVNVGDPRFQ